MTPSRPAPVRLVLALVLLAFGSAAIADPPALDPIGDGYVPAAGDGQEAMGAQESPFEETDAAASPTRLPPGVVGPGAMAAGATAAWVRTVDLSLAAREYELSQRDDVEGKFGWTAPNRSNELRTQWVSGQVTLEPRRLPAGDEGWSFSWQLFVVGRESGMEEAKGCPIASTVTDEKVSHATLTWERGSITEWYLNDAAGVEQGFDVAEPPSGALDGRPGEPLRVRGLISGLVPRVSDEGGQVLLSDPTGKRGDVLSIRGLFAVDATGMSLPTRFELGDGTLDLVVDDSKAAYPISIDPLYTLPAVMMRSNQANANLGVSVASAGDVDRDGYADVIVGAYLYDNGQPDEGAAFLYRGSLFGPSSTAAWMAESDQAAGWLGISVASAGDVNGDGYADVVVGASKYDNGHVDEGSAFVWTGSAAGLGVTGKPSNAKWRAESDKNTAYFGNSVAGAGDVNGDGFGDLLVGSYNYPVTFGTTPVASGGVFLWFGGLAAVSNPSGLGPNGKPANADWQDLANQRNMQLGWVVASAGDTNGDRKSEILASANLFDLPPAANHGAIHVYATPLPPGGSEPDWIAVGALAANEFGYSAASAGDVNGDGFADVIAGAPYGSGRVTPLAREGVVLMWLGGRPGIGDRTGLGPVISGLYAGTQALADWSAEGDQANSRFGWAVSSVPDITACTNRSGVLVGAPLYDRLSKTDRGLAAMWDSRAGLFGMGPNGVITATPPGNASWFALGDDPNDQFGYSVAGTADTNRDGVSDAIIGIPFGEASSFINEGQAYVYAGLDNDVDGDTILDACDTCIDFDRDGFGDPGYPWNTCRLDNCPGVSNPSQLDTDGDGQGDACDNCTDSDGDCSANPGSPTGNVCGIYFCPTDNCPGLFNPGNLDTDGDGRGNACDNCPGVANPGQQNCDGDALGDACDPDDDNDGALDGVDSNDCNRFVCRDSEANPGPPAGTGDGCDDCWSGTFNPGNDGADCEGDGLCDIGDKDDDNDTVLDASDPAPCDPVQCGDSDADTCDDCSSGTRNPAQDGPECAGEVPVRDGLCDAGDTDDDGDLVLDFQDTQPCNAIRCRDVDGDLCDDCSSGSDNPANDGADCDADGRCDLGDPDDDNDGVGDFSGDFFPCNRFRCNDTDGDGCDDCSGGSGDQPGNDGPECVNEAAPADGLCDFGDNDDDNDGRFDGVDTFDCDPFRCGDTDLDNTLGTCDDCRSGRFDPMNDGPECADETPRDGQCDDGDTDDDNDGVADTGDSSDCNRHACIDSETPGSGPPAIGDFCDDCWSGVFDPANDGYECYNEAPADDYCDTGDTDDDGDGILDISEAPGEVCSLTPGQCGDVDGDMCDDCFSGVFDPANDGPECPTELGPPDGLCDAGDPDDDNDGIPDGSEGGTPCSPNNCGDVDNDGCDDCDPTEAADCDGDGRCDFGELDDDGDTVPDTSEPNAPAECDKFVCGDAADGDSCDDCSLGNGVQPNNDGPDCDADGACDAGDTDDDNDARLDGLDSDDCNPRICADTDGDGCDDCASGTFNVNSDGPDCDSDGRCDFSTYSPPSGTPDTDDDNDGILDGSDPQTCNPDVCGDSDNDLCDDCTVGTDNFGPASDSLPGNDGTNTDDSGETGAKICDNGDLDDDNDGVSDASDPQRLNPDFCGDSDGDFCDDCAIGTDNFGPMSDRTPANDGTECASEAGGQDGLCDAGDLDDDNDGSPDGDDSDDCDPLLCSDLDSDGCNDCTNGSFNPLNDGTDCDADGICNGPLDLDDDNDGRFRPNDSNDCNNFACSDTDGDTCEDCFNGHYDPNNDGPDCDGDGRCNASDPDDDNDGSTDSPPEDTQPCNPFICIDTDGDTCNDCVNGTKNPYNDGTDSDGDGLCNSGDPDRDGDQRLNGVDSFPDDRFRCAFTDSDNCDDCSSGVFNPANDGPDFDTDGLCNNGDPDDDNDGCQDSPLSCDPCPTNPSQAPPCTCISGSGGCP